VVNVSRLSISIVAGLSLLIGCGGDNLTLPSEREPAHIEIQSGNNQNAPVSSELAPLVVRVTDTQNRPVEGATVNFVLDNTGGGGSVNPASAVTDTGGRASTTLTLGTQVGELAGQAQVVVEAGSNPVAAGFVATAVSANANVISMFSGDGQSGPVGSTLGAPLVIQVTDAFGNPIPDVPIQWTAEAGGSVSETSNVTDGNGQASVTRTLGPSAGEQRTLARADGLAGSPVVFIHTATAGNAARVIIVSGDGQQAAPGSRLPNPLVVQVLDAENNPIVATAVAWVVQTGDGNATPETSLTDDQGRASTEWTLGPLPGRNTLTAVVSGVGNAAFTATATKASSNTSITSHQPDPSTIGQAVEVRVEVTGSGATPTGTVNVTAENGGSCTITLANGTGVCTLTFTAPGNHRITATYSGDSRFNGSSDDENHRVNAQNAPPTAAFTPPSCVAGQSCQFTDGSSDSDGNVVAWTWEFCDGGTANDQNPTHTYVAAGSFNVKLTVRDDDGATSEIIQGVTVSAPQNNPPVASDDSFTTDEGETLSVAAPGVLANDSDPEGSPLTATLASPPSGIVILMLDGSFEYFPGSAPEGSQDSFTYSVSDGSLTSTATVVITID
jgi:PKD repeat protein